MDNIAEVLQKLMHDQVNQDDILQFAIDYIKVRSFEHYPTTSGMITDLADVIERLFKLEEHN